MFWNSILIWMAFSAREPNITPNPYDYEYSGGWETKQSWIATDARFLWERENGQNYTGRIHNYRAKYFVLGEYYKEAKSINQQKAILKYPNKTKHFTTEIGFGVILKEYGNPEFTLYNRLKSKYVEMEISTFERLHFISIKAKYRWSHKTGFFIEPVTRFYMVPDKKDWSAKIKIGYQIKNKPFGKMRMQ